MSSSDSASHYATLRDCEGIDGPPEEALAVSSGHDITDAGVETTLQVHVAQQEKERERIFREERYLQSLTKSVSEVSWEETWNDDIRAIFATRRRPMSASMESLELELQTFG